MAGGGGGEESQIALEFTPTWIVTVVCSVIVLISFVFERGLHRLGQSLKKRNQTPLFDALQKVKEELMLLGFISLLLTVFQGAIQKICIRESLTHHMLPCKLEDRPDMSTTAHFATSFFSGVLGSGRRLLSGGGGGSSHCKEGKVPLLSVEAVHQLHIFIFVLAVTHVVLSVITMVLGGAQMRQWKNWETSIQEEDETVPTLVIVHQNEFVKDRFKGHGKVSSILSWLHAFIKQFYGSITKSDYKTMRRGFIAMHIKSNPKFDFHKYMTRALEADFKKVVGISWYLWVFVMVFLLLNVNGWHVYFWISLIPLILLLTVGAKLEHIITDLAHQVASKHAAVIGHLEVTPSDELFWFNQPGIVLFLIHFILFQNAFEIAFFFWILTAYGFDSCIMGAVGFIVPRLVISVIVQLLCSYSTLPLYAIVTQMGSSFKGVIFEDHVQEGLVGWAQGAKKRKGKKVMSTDNRSNMTEPKYENSAGIQLQNVFARDSPTEEGKGEIVEVKASPPTTS